MRISLIAAMARNRVVGRDNRIPWRISEDLKRFKAATLGCPVIMGRKTYESIGRLLPGRPNIIVSRQPGYRIEGATCVASLEAALAAARERVPADGEIFIAGGGEIYALALPIADRLVLTVLDRDYEGDARFPQWPESGERAFRLVSREERETTEEGGLKFSYRIYERA